MELEIGILVFLRVHDQNLAAKGCLNPKIARYMANNANTLLTTRTLRGTNRATRRGAGQFPAAFTHLALISAAFNLDRMLGS